MTIPNIRRATRSDIKELEFLLTKLGYQITTEALTVQFQHYDQPASTVLVSECAATNKIVGLISGHVIPLLHQPGFLGRITVLIVADESRGIGVGKKLIHELERWFVEKQCIRYEVTSSDHRKMAHSFYEKLGYSQDERRFIKLP